MTPREFRQEQEFEFDHFQELTNTGIKPNYVNIELFAHEYHKRKLKLLGIGGVIKSYSEKNMDDAYDKGYNDGASAADTDIMNSL